MRPGRLAALPLGGVEVISACHARVATSSQSSTLALFLLRTPREKRTTMSGWGLLLPLAATTAGGGRSQRRQC